MTEPTTKYHYLVKYYIVDSFGDIHWQGECMIIQSEPTPTGETEEALYLARTAKTIRKSCDEQGVRAGRVLVAAIFPQTDRAKGF